MKLQLPSKVTRTFHRTGLKIKKYSPEILVGAGIIGGVTAAVMACKATTKLDTILDDAQYKIEKIHEHVENPELLPEGKTYTEADAKNDLTITYAHTALDVIKLYAPAIAVGTLSVTAILAGHHVLRKRNVALAAAYTAVDRSFKDYRGRVVERFGEKLDKELRYNIKAEEVEEVITNEDGSETIVKTTKEVAKGIPYSEYSFVFDEACLGWTKNPDYNKKFLIDQQRYANDLLKQRGHLFLNEVLDMLGIPRCTMGQMVGWIYDEKHPNGDNYVDFGIFDITIEKNRDFLNGYERNVILDFNVDGVIHDKI